MSAKAPTTPWPLDLAAIEVRREAAYGRTWHSQPGETEAEFADRMDREQVHALWETANDVPALVVEIMRLRSLLEAEGIWYQDDEQPPAAVPFDGLEGLIDVKKRKGVEKWVLTCSECGEVGRYDIVFQVAKEPLEPEQAWDRHVAEKHPEAVDTP